MSAEELATLKAEAATPPPALDPEIAARLPALDDVIAPIIAIGGWLICRRANVTSLTHDEIKDMASAVGVLATLYEIGGNLDPRSAAWLGLGMVTLGVIGNRRPLAPKEPAAQTADIEAEGKGAADPADDIGGPMSAGEVYEKAAEE